MCKIKFERKTNMGNIKNEVFLGTKEMQNKKFELLACLNPKYGHIKKYVKQIHIEFYVTISFLLIIDLVKKTKL